MGNFIVGVGTHAGSVWLARILSHFDSNTRFENERLAKWIKHQHWSHVLKRQLDHGLAEDEVFAPYFANVRKRLEQFKIWGDFNSWSPPFIPAVAEIVPVDRVLGLMRNGIQQLFSLVNGYIWQRVTDDHYLIAGHLHNLWKTAGARGKPWEERTLWEKKCEMWASTPYLYEWLKGQGLDVYVYRLEDLTGNCELLSLVINSFTDALIEWDRHSYAFLRAYQGQDTNRKIWTDRTPISLWRKWTREQQIAFNEICGDAMCNYGYKVLEVGA